MRKTVHLDQLQQVQELNRAFLGLLQSRAQERRNCLGLPPGLEPVLASAHSSWLEAVASLPRSLFSLQLGASSWPSCARSAEDFDEDEYALCLSILIGARQASRQSPYEARLLFGLEPAEIGRLAAAPLIELQRLGAEPGVLACAFTERPWLWRSLLTATRPEQRHQLTLMALQPRVALGWPRRRPPQATA